MHAGKQKLRGNLIAEHIPRVIRGTSIIRESVAQCFAALWLAFTFWWLVCLTFMPAQAVSFNLHVLCVCGCGLLCVVPSMSYAPPSCTFAVFASCALYEIVKDGFLDWTLFNDWHQVYLPFSFLC